MHPHLSLDLDLVKRIDRIEADSLRGEEEVAGVGGVWVRTFGSAVAFISPGYPNTLFNRALGIVPEEADRIGEIVDWYREYNIPPRIDVCPRLCFGVIEAALHGEGLRPGGFPFFARRVMAGRPPVLYEETDGVEVRQVGREEIEDFSSVFAGTWPMPPGEIARRHMVALATVSWTGIRRYLAFVEGEVAAAATLHLTGGDAFLSLAATLPAHRGKGCHTALIRRRLAAAASAGAEVVSALVAPDSGSERNLLHSGLKVVCDRDTWLPPDWAGHRFYRDVG